MPWGNGVSTRKKLADGTFPDLRVAGSVVLVPEAPMTVESAGPADGRARLLSVQTDPDGSGIVRADLSGCYTGTEELADVAGRPKCVVRDLGIRAVRSIAVDHSGKTGVPVLVVVADQLTGTKTNNVWQLCTAPEHDVAVADNTFTIRAKNGATLRGTVVTPAPPVIKVEPARFVHEINYHARHRHAEFTRQVIRVSGGETFLVVLTVQTGEAPAVKRDGGKITVGGKALTFDGEQILTEEIGRTK